MSKEDQKRREAEILREITKAASDLGEKSPGGYVRWADVANLLNERGVRTIFRKIWTGNYLREYCSTRLPDLFLDQTDKQVYSSQKEGSESVKYKGNVFALSDDEIKQIRQMLNEYRKRKIAVGHLGGRPKFKNPRKNTGIRCNEEILQRASAKVKEMEKETGGKLNSLIELLLWQFIGCPDDVVQGYEIDS